MIRIQRRAFVTGEGRRWPTAFVRDDWHGCQQTAFATAERRRWQKVVARGDRHHCWWKVATGDWHRFPRKFARADWRRLRSQPVAAIEKIPNRGTRAFAP